MNERRILVVDDDKASADTTAIALDKFTGGRLKAEAVYGGKACLERLSREPRIDIVLLDLNMPEINGADVIRALLKWDPPPSCRVLLTTAWGSDWAKHWGLTSLQQSPEYRRLVFEESCDKASDLREIVEVVDRLAGDDAR